MKFVLFGAGGDGKSALREIGKENVYCFIDNAKTGNIEGIPIFSMHHILEKMQDDMLVIITSQKYGKEMACQLREHKLKNYIFYKKNIFALNDYEKRLSVEEWGDIYNEELVDIVVKNVQNSNCSIQAHEMLKLTGEKDKVLEIGCGSGETSLYLANNGRRVSAIDYSVSSIKLVNRAAEIIGCRVDTYCLDAMEALPFEKHEFDMVFQAGLLEHFDKEQRIKMLSNWRSVCNTMISIIPNAHSLAYRVGKKMAESEGTWQYGLEMPQATLCSEFQQAGFTDIKEYTIGEYQALNFLPQNHYLRVALKQWFDEQNTLEDLGQGYLLVTIGKNSDCI